MKRITIEDFEKVEMRVGQIIAVQDFPKARKPSYRLTIDFGPYGIKRSSAALRSDYTPAELLGRQIVAVTNFPPRQIADFMSEVLVLGVIEHSGTPAQAKGGGRIVLLQPDKEAELGARIG